MAADIKFIGVNYILSKLQSDLSLYTEIRQNDVIEWIGEAVEYIGAFHQFEDKMEVLEIIDHQGILPCDYYLMDQCYMDNCLLTRAKQPVYPHLKKARDKKVMEYRFRGIDVYSIQGQYIYTDKIKGNLSIHYKGFAVDDEGIPLVPDVIEYKDAVIAYIIMKVKYAEVFSGRLSPNEYEFYRIEWNSKKLAAGSILQFPTPDDTESIGRRFTRLVKDTLDKQDFSHRTTMQERNI